MSNMASFEQVPRSKAPGFMFLMLLIRIVSIIMGITGQKKNEKLNYVLVGFRIHGLWQSFSIDFFIFLK